MGRKLSFEKIDSYAGDVLPLRLLGDEDYTKEDITWKTSDPCVQIKTYVGKYEASFTNGVLLTLLYPGTATVTATFRGEEYSCPVSIHERKTHSSEEEFNYYIGDFHDHTCNIHNRKDFSVDPLGETMLDVLKAAGMNVVGIGKIEDIFNFRGLTSSDHAAGNEACVDSLIEMLKKDGRRILLLDKPKMLELYNYEKEI